MKLIYGDREIEIDDVDWSLVKLHLWYPTKDGMRTKIKGDCVMLHRYIMDAKPGEVVSFGPAGVWNYKRSNLTKRDRAISTPEKRVGVYPTKSGKFAARFPGQISQELSPTN